MALPQKRSARNIIILMETINDIYRPAQPPNKVDEPPGRRASQHNKNTNKKTPTGEER
jgi:hypothetical protein